MKFGVLILAAGASTRLGIPKQLVRLQGETLLERSVRIAKQAGGAPVVVVLGANEEQIRNECAFQDVSIVSNSSWAEGMGSSLSRGVREFEDVSGILVMTCDMPAVTPNHLYKLASSATVTASLYAGRNGVPAYFPKNLFPDLLKIKGDVGARDLIRYARVVELWGGEFDIDTNKDLVDAQRMF